MSKAVLSILSSGHSGSTLLDIVLGSIPGVFSMGEFHYLSWQAWRNGEQSENGQDMCTCGSTFINCSCWGDVLSKLSEKHGVDYRNDPLRLKLVLYGRDSYVGQTQFIHRLHRELTCRSFQIPFGSRVIASSLNLPIAAKVQNNLDVFDQLFDSTGVRCIVDSTKDVSRFQALRSKRPEQFVPLVLYRNARGIASSAIKYDRDPRRDLAVWLKNYNRRIFPVLQRLGCDYECVEYEELTENPDVVRDRIATRLGIEKSPCPDVFYSKDYHLVAGNPMRYKPEIAIRYDDSWKDRLSPELLELADSYQLQLKVSNEYAH